MDRRSGLSPNHGRQWSTSSGDTGESLSPAGSPAHPLFRGGAGGVSTVKRTQNVAAKVAARRLAQVMATQPDPNEDDDFEDGDDDDGGFRFPLPSASPSRFGEDVRARNHLPPSNLPAISVRHNRAPSPALGRNFGENHAVSARSTSAGRASTNTDSAALGAATKNSIKTPNGIPHVQLPTTKSREQRAIPALGQVNVKDQENHHDAFALYDELDMLQEENERILDMLQRAEEKREEAEARARMLENQVASLGEGVSLEAKLLNRKEEALRRRELALKAESQRRDGKGGEIATLRAELENFKEEAARTMEQLQEAESEAKAMRTMTQRAILTHEEMEEVVLKRCWLARYWGLAVQYGICAEIAVSKYEFWSALAPLPFEVVISAGQKAKDDFMTGGSPNKANRLAQHPNNLTGEGNIESMLSVEMGLRELASLKIEDAVAIAQRRRPNFVRDPKSSLDPKFIEAYELSQEELNDVLFKQAWLIYFWNRARNHGVEGDIADEQLQFWSSRGSQPTFHDAVDVERGLVELRKLGIEQQLWEASRREVEHLPFLSNGIHRPSSASETSP